MTDGEQTTPDYRHSIREVTSYARIELDGSGYGTVEVCGTQMQGTTGFTIESRAGHPSRLTLDVLLMNGVDFEGEAIVTLRAETARSLVALGWTPPATTAAALETDAPYVTEREARDES